MNIEACENVYGKFLSEDENFCYFEGKGPFGVTIPKHAYFDIRADRLRRVDTGDSEAIVGSANIDEIAESSRND